MFFFFFFSSRRRHTRCSRDWSSDVCSSDLAKRRCESKRGIERTRGSVALLEVSDSDGKIIFQSKPFKKPFGTVPPITKVKSLSTLSTLTVCSTASPLGLPRSTAKLFGFGPPFQIRQRSEERRVGKE